MDNRSRYTSRDDTEGEIPYYRYKPKDIRSISLSFKSELEREAKIKAQEEELQDAIRQQARKELQEKEEEERAEKWRIEVRKAKAYVAEQQKAARDQELRGYLDAIETRKPGTAWFNEPPPAPLVEFVAPAPIRELFVPPVGRELPQVDPVQYPVGFDATDDVIGNFFVNQRNLVADDDVQEIEHQITDHNFINMKRNDIANPFNEEMQEEEPALEPRNKILGKLNLSSIPDELRKKMPIRGEIRDHPVDGILGKRAYQQLAQVYDNWKGEPDRTAFMMRNSQGKLISQHRHGGYHYPYVSPRQLPGGQTDGVYYDGYGLMPQKIYDRVGGEGILQTNPLTRSALRQVWGGALGPVPAKVTSTVKDTFDDQYANVIQAIEQTLGTRLKTDVWQGRIATHKAIWDMWIDYVKIEWVQGIQSKAVVKSQFTIPPALLDSTQLTEMTHVVVLGKNLIDMSIFLEKNLALDDNKKIYLVVELFPSIPLDQESVAKMFIVALLRDHPGFRDKLFWVSKGADYKVFLRIRSFNKNTSEIKWKLLPKYGPFDVLYSKFGTFKKTYVDAADFNPKGVGEDTDGTLQGTIIQENIRASLKQQLDEFAGTTHANMLTAGPDVSFQFMNFALMGTEELMTEIEKAKSVTVKTLRDDMDYFLYLRANHTLAKWFSGKKSALQKINQERITSYLDRDKQNLKNVMHFFGGDAKFVDKKR